MYGYGYDAWGDYRNDDIPQLKLDDLDMSMGIVASYDKDGNWGFVYQSHYLCVECAPKEIYEYMTPLNPNMFDWAYINTCASCERLILEPEIYQTMQDNKEKKTG